MIDAIIFDLDGTLVRTERLKALSYARAAVELDPDLEEEPVIEAFKYVAGKSRREVATSLMDRFELQEPSRDRMQEFGVSSPWQAYVQIRLSYYEKLLSSPGVLREHRWPHTMALLDRSRELKCKIALATMSRCEQAVKVLAILDLKDAFDFVATRDDVENSKPDPEIYQLVAHELDARPSYTLVVEDSVPGVTAALNAGMHVVAIATPFTGRHLHESGLLRPSHIVDDPDELPEVVEHVSGHIGT